MEKSVEILVVAFKNLDEFLKRNYKIIKDNNVRLIIADNADNKDLAEKYPDVIYRKMQSNIGYGNAINRIYGEVNTDYMMICNDDVYYENDFFKKLFSHIDFYRKNDIDIIGVNVNNQRKKGLHKILYNPLVIIYHFSFIPKILTIFSTQNGYAGAFETIHFSKSSKYVKGVNGSCFIIKKESFKRLDGFDKRIFLTYEETDLFRRLLSKGGKIYYDKELRIYHEHTFTKDSLSLIFSVKSMDIFLKEHYNICIYLSTKVFVHVSLFIKYLFLKGEKNEIIKKSKFIIK